MNSDQLAKVGSAPGFIAALDQSGGSTPTALARYGVDSGAYESEAEMFDLVHAMRTRIIRSPSFGGDRVLAAILFEMTMDRDIDGQPTADYLWSKKQVVPFLKVDKGLADLVDGTQVMNPMPDLLGLLARARDRNIFGTKMRSVIKLASVAGVAAVVEQQFEVALQILGAGLMPIIEPEVDIHCPDKAEAEALLLEQLVEHLDTVPEGQQVMFKLTLPEADNFYANLIADPRVLRVVALSGGYSRADANRLLARNNGMVASFSRALAEGLSFQQGDAEFDTTLDESIGQIFAASVT